MKHNTNAKKITALLLATFLFVMSFSACGQKENPQKPMNQAPVSAGTFSMTSLNGETVTEEIFKTSKLTLVNVMATWCGPCVQEMPELQKLSENYKDKGLTVIAIVMDTMDSKGKPDPKAIEEAKRLSMTAGVSFPMLQAKPGVLAGKVDKVASLPTTFFVDGNGNFVGKMQIGAKNYEAWAKTVDALLAEVEA